MSNNLTVCNFRLSDDMLRCIEQRSSEAQTKEDVVVLCILKFVVNPVYYSSLSVRALRAPLTNIMSVKLPAQTVKKIKTISTMFGNVPSSQIIRMAIYHEVMRRESA